MMTPAQVDQVLRQHDCRSCGGSTNREMTYLRYVPCQKLLEEVCALAPTPSRRDVEEIINNQSPSYAHPQWRQHTVDRLMALFTGQPEQAAWCPHIIWQSGRWLFYLDESGPIAISERWQVCPFCGQARPGARGG